MIGSGMPSSHSNAPRPNVIVALSSVNDAGEKVKPAAQNNEAAPDPQYWNDQCRHDSVLSFQRHEPTFIGRGGSTWSGVRQEALFQVQHDQFKLNSVIATRDLAIEPDRARRAGRIR